MLNIQTKQNKGLIDDSKSELKLGAGETNSFVDEIKNAIVSTGQTLPPNTTQVDPFPFQLSKSLFVYGAGAGTFLDSGIADAYVVTPATGISGLVFPDDYNFLEGIEISFIAGNTCTGASTLDIGQDVGSLLGPKKILSLQGAPIIAGAIVSGKLTRCRFENALDTGSGGWRTLSASSEDAGIGLAEIYFYAQFTDC